MSLELNVNLTSLHMIREELDSTISQSATDFEAFLADQNDEQYLISSRDKIAQVGGVFRLLEFPGAALIADEMALLIDVIGNKETKTTTAMTDAITHAYFVLPRYIEYIELKKMAMPTLVIPYINEMRVSRRDSLLPEYHFYKGDIPTMGIALPSTDVLQLDQLLNSAKRLNHMYQAGLVGALKDPANKLHYQFMARAIERLSSLLGDHPSAAFWQIAHAVLECFAVKRLELTLNRKRNLAALEKGLRIIASKGESGLNAEISAELKKDLLFQLMLTNCRHKLADEVREAYSLPQMQTSDDDIIAQRKAMHGPTGDTLSSVTQVLKEELRQAKDILELSAQNEKIENEEVNSLSDITLRVADTLLILNLQSPRETLIDQSEKINGWKENPDSISRAECLMAADTILYIESALSSLERNEITTDELNTVDEETRKLIIANSQLAEAERLVLEEAQSGIAMAKRAITSYVDSNFDMAHIANVSTTLNTVRGGLHILNYTRAATILKSCSAFIESNTKGANANDQRHQLLDTLADALISLEYYLYELTTNPSVNEKILDVAEESLAALGFSVSAEAVSET